MHCVVFVGKKSNLLLFLAAPGTHTHILSDGGDRQTPPHNEEINISGAITAAAATVAGEK